MEEAQHLRLRSRKDKTRPGCRLVPVNTHRVVLGSTLSAFCLQSTACAARCDAPVHRGQPPAQRREAVPAHPLLLVLLELRREYAGTAAQCRHAGGFAQTAMIQAGSGAWRPRPVHPRRQQVNSRRRGHARWGVPGPGLAHAPAPQPVPLRQNRPGVQ